jgi:hypothetical protein
MYWVLYTFWPNVNGAPQLNGFETLTGHGRVRRRRIWHLFIPALVVFLNGTSLKCIPDTAVHGLHGLKEKMPLEWHKRRGIHLFD